MKPCTTPAITAAILIVSIALLAVPAGAQIQQVRDLAGFDAVDVSSNIDLALQQGSEFYVEITDPNGEPEKILTEIQGRTLTIRRQRESLFQFGWADSPRVSITLPKLTSLKASGGSDVNTQGRIAGDRLEIVSSGGSDIRIDVEVDELMLRTSGGSDLTLMGSARTVDAQSGGGSDISASRFQAVEATLRSSGGADIAITVRDRLTANASGGSDIVYSGDPAYVNVGDSRAGNVRRR
jgi:hypothetical protein